MMVPSKSVITELTWTGHTFIAAHAQFFLNKMIKRNMNMKKTKLVSNVFHVKKKYLADISLKSEVTGSKENADS